MGKLAVVLPSVLETCVGHQACEGDDKKGVLGEQSIVTHIQD